MPSRIASTSTGIGKGNTVIDSSASECCFSVRFFWTVVYDETPNKIVLSTGGWNTPTTIRRINQALAYRLGSSGKNVSIRDGVPYYGNEPFVSDQYVIVR